MTIAATPPQDLSTLLGADLVSSTIPERIRADLVTTLNKQVIPDIPDFSKSLDHTRYLELRTQYAAVASLAGVAGDARLSEVVQRWAKLQEGYARQVIKQTKEGVSDLQELPSCSIAPIKLCSASGKQLPTLPI